MEEQTERGNVKVNRTCKDSVFCDLFSQPKSMLELYRELHPEDTTATEDDLEVITIDRFVTTGIYNDLGFTVKGRLLVLVEAQSTFSPNIATRLLFYLAETYRRILDSQRPRAIYGTKAVTLPSPELYVVFTGDQEVPAQVDFARDILRDPNARLQFSVGVIAKNGGAAKEDGIVSQYLRFSELFDERWREPGPVRDKAARLLEECIKRGILVEYLRSRYKEVHDIMVSLFSQEEITQDRIDYEVEKAVEKAVEEATEKATEKATKEGILAGIASTVKHLMQSQGVNADAAMSMAGIAPGDQAKVLELVQAGQ